MATHRPHSPITLDSAGNERPSEDAQQKGMSQQQRTMIGVGVLIVCLLIGGGIIYWMLFGAAPKQRSIKVDPQQQTPDVMRSGMTRAPRPVQRIIREDDNAWQVRGTSGAMRIEMQGGIPKITPYYPGRDFLTPDQVALVAGFVRAKRDEAMAKEWGITTDQLTKLKAIELGGSMLALSNAEQGELRTLWDQYQKAGDGAAKSEAEKKLITRLDELGKANLEASRKAFAARLEQIRAVLTPQQVQKIGGR